MDKKFDPGIEERRVYYRLWRSKNHERVKEYRERYWKRRAVKKREAVSSPEVADMPNDQNRPKNGG